MSVKLNIHYFDSKIFPSNFCALETELNAMSRGI